MKTFFQHWWLFGIFLAIGIILHGIPNWNVPLNSDVTWIFRLHATNENLFTQPIPEIYKVFGASPYQSFWESFIALHQFFGRFNLIDHFFLVLTAIIATDNGNLWRLIYIFFLTGSLYFFYLISQKLGVPKKISILLLAGLFVSPSDIWIDHRTSEPRAIFFLMLGYFLAFSSQKKLLPHLFSAIFIAAAVLTKESFLFAWVLIPGIILYQKLNDYKKRFLSLKYTLIALVPHIVIGSGVLLFVWYVDNFYPVNQLNYVTSLEIKTNPFNYLSRNIINTLPYLFLGMWKIIFTLILGLVGLIVLTQKGLFKSYLRQFITIPQITIVIFLLLTTIASFLPYYLTGRDLIGRYLLPTTYLVALSIGVLITPVFNFFSQHKTNLLIGYFFGALLFYFIWPRDDQYPVLSLFLITVILIIYKLFSFFKQANAFKLHNLIFIIIISLLLIRPLDYVIKFSIQNRIDQEKWQRLITETYLKAPPNGHVVLNFDDPYMDETAFSLESNIIMKGRQDLTFHLIITDPDKYQKATNFTKSVNLLFNQNRKPPSIHDSPLVITANRNGYSQDLSKNLSINSFLRDPRKHFFDYYLKGRNSYLNYSIE